MKISKNRLLHQLLFSLFILAVTTGCGVTTTINEPTPVILQLKWIHQAQFAGYYTAAREEFYAAENLEVQILPGGPGIDVLKELEDGRADFAIAPPEKILIARGNGIPLVAIATIYRRNPFVLVSLPETNILHPFDLGGKTIATGGIDGNLQVEMLLTEVNLSMEDVEIIPYQSDLRPFYDGEIDVMPAFAAGSLVTMQSGAGDREFNLLWPEDFGVHFYSDTIVTTEQMIVEQPELVAAFVRATLRGHAVIVEDPATAVAHSLTFDPDGDPQVQEAMVLASIPLIHTGTGNIGEMETSVWAGMQEILLADNALTTPVDLSLLIDNQFVASYYQE